MQTVGPSLFAQVQSGEVSLNTAMASRHQPSQLSRRPGGRGDRRVVTSLPNQIPHRPPEGRRLRGASGSHRRASRSTARGKALRQMRRGWWPRHVTDTLWDAQPTGIWKQMGPPAHPSEGGHDCRITVAWLRNRLVASIAVAVASVGLARGGPHASGCLSDRAPGSLAVAEQITAAPWLTVPPPTPSTLSATPTSSPRASILLHRTGATWALDPRSHYAYA
jgi:hypothetical protein